MTAAVVEPRSGRVVVAVLGCAMLAARPALIASSSRPALLLSILFALLLAIAVSVPVPRTSPATRVSVAPLLMGIAAFGAARLLVPGHAPTKLALPVLAANTLAAVAEEAWFRRYCYALLAPGGTAFAIGGTALLFALVHVASYGIWVLPIDLAAGVLLGWQRAVTGSWTVPAYTHAIANLLVLL
jgi:hypothetical protein